MNFDMIKFRARAKKYLARSKASSATVSNKLFGNAKTLEGVLDGSISPRFDTLLRSDKLLSELESALEVAK